MADRRLFGCVAALCAAGLLPGNHASAEEGKKLRVGLTVKCDDKAVQAQLLGHMKRHLHALGDVAVVDAVGTPTYTVSLALAGPLEVKLSDAKVAVFAASAAVTLRRYSKEFSGKIPGTAERLSRTVQFIVEAVTVEGVLKAHSAAFVAPFKMPEYARDVVASLNTEYLEPLRHGKPVGGAARIFSPMEP